MVQPAQLAESVPSNQWLLLSLYVLSLNKQIKQNTTKRLIRQQKSQKEQQQENKTTSPLPSPNTMGAGLCCPPTLGHGACSSVCLMYTVTVNWKHL